MKILDLEPSNALSYGAVLEKIEIFRSKFRWAQSLDHAEIQKLLAQANSLREDIMVLSRKERFVDAATTLEALPLASAEEQSAAQRRAGLLERDFVFEGVFGDNPELLQSLEIAEKAAPTELPVLIHGESGTGKELLAKVVHANGPRSDGLFVTINCGAIPENLIESELFGHTKGSFTGAASDRQGKFESASGGTIFLDEIGELPLTGQVKLLRVLQSQEIQRVGSDKTIHVDARIVAAINRNLLEMAQEGTFREDLYYRLGVIEVLLPPLRERRDEIEILIAFFCDEAAEKLNRTPLALAPDLRDFLLRYGFPGNIRELHNLIFRMSCLAGERASLQHLPSSVRDAPVDDFLSSIPTNDSSDDGSGSLADAKRAAADSVEKQYLERGLRETSGKVTELAKRWDMNRSHLQTMMKRHGFSAMDFRAKTARDKNPQGAANE